MKKIEAFQCNYCPKFYKSKSKTKGHEGKCYYNPVTKSCGSCGWFATGLTTYENPCLVRGTSEKDAEGRTKLKTNCEKWIDKNTLLDMEIPAIKDLFEKLHLPECLFECFILVNGMDEDD